VLVHGLFADGSSWSEVIARLQKAGLNCHGRAKTPLTTLPEASRLGRAPCSRRQEWSGRSWLGHSFSGMIVTEGWYASERVGLLSMWRRGRRNAGEDYTALAKDVPDATGHRPGIVFRRR